jgi:hypothetical protein
VRRVLLGDRRIQGAGERAGRPREKQVGVLGRQREARRAAQSEGLAIRLLVESEGSRPRGGRGRDEEQAVRQRFARQVARPEIRPDLLHGGRFARPVDARATGGEGAAREKDQKAEPGG